MSAPEARASSGASPGLRLGRCRMDVVELCAFRGRAADLENVAAGRGVRLGLRGTVRGSGGELSLCVRPERWLLLAAPAHAGTMARSWEAACAGAGAAVDLSGALAAFVLEGPAAREVLCRGCRLDLDPQEFPAGRAAVTLMAQVSVIIAAVPAGMLLLTPSSTARHFHEWLAAAAQPFAPVLLADVTVAAVSGDQWS